MIRPHYTLTSNMRLPAIEMLFLNFPCTLKLNFHLFNKLLNFYFFLFKLHHHTFQLRLSYICSSHQKIELQNFNLKSYSISLTIFFYVLILNKYCLCMIKMKMKKSHSLFTVGHIIYKFRLSGLKLLFISFSSS